MQGLKERPKAETGPQKRPEQLQFIGFIQKQNEDTDERERAAHFVNPQNNKDYFLYESEIDAAIAVQNAPQVSSDIQTLKIMWLASVPTENTTRFDLDILMELKAGMYAQPSLFNQKSREYLETADPTLI